MSHVFILIADNPGMIAFEHIFEAVADGGIQRCHVVDRYALAIRGIGHEYACGGSLFPLCYRLDLYVDPAAYSCLLDVFLGNRNRFGRYVGSDNRIFGGALG